MNHQMCAFTFSVSQHYVLSFVEYSALKDFIDRVTEVPPLAHIEHHLDA